METYIGHRYVPKIMGVWNKLLSYGNLSIVTYDNSSYTSKTIVPVGVEISNEKYWVKTGDYNAQVEEFKNDFTAQLAQTKNKINNGLIHNEFKQGIVTFIFDDGFSSVFENAYPVFRGFRVPANIGVITKNLESSNDGMMTAQELLQVNSDGWELLSHGYDSYNMQTESTGNNNAPYRDIELNSKVLAERYGINLNGWVSPYGWIHKDHMKYVYKNYSFAYDSYAQDLTNYENSIYNLNRIDLSTLTVSDAENLILKAKNEHRLLTFYAHGVTTIDTGFCDNSVAITKLLTTCQTKAIPILTCSEAMNYLFSVENKTIKNDVKKIDLLDNTENWTLGLVSQTTITIEDTISTKRLRFADTKATTVATAVTTSGFIDIIPNRTTFMDIDFKVKARAHNYNSKLTWRLEAIVDNTTEIVSLYPDYLYQGYSPHSDKDFKIKVKIPNNINSSKVRLRFFYRSGASGSDDLTYIENLTYKLNYVE